MFWRIEIQHRPGIFDPASSGVQKDIYDLGITTIDHVEVVRVFNLQGDLTVAETEMIAARLLTDPLTQSYQIRNRPPRVQVAADHRQVIEIAHNPGVTDPVEASTLKGIRDLGIPSIESVRTACQYILVGKLTSAQKNLIITKVLSNKLIQHVVDHGGSSGRKHKRIQSASVGRDVQVQWIALSEADDTKLMQINADGQLFLNLNEMRTIQNYFREMGRDPTDVELETIAQTWSEHCNHKTFRGKIRYTQMKGGRATTTVIDNLLKSTIAQVTYTLKKPWCISVFHDNAGVIAFDEDDHVCFKVETHNHPSALEPFGGANTGIGGVIRDILGTGLGARPVCSTDVFCFAPPDTDFKSLPPGTLHPKRVMKGVVSGVRDYGNKMGIPTVNGAICFDPHYVGNPLVYCGNVGILPVDKVQKESLKGDLIVTVGGRTGRDGIHGATFSSGELTTDSEVVSSGAVQIGDPIQEKKVLDGLLLARDESLYNAITDCGAGGFSSAVGEMGQTLGARVDLEKAPLKYQGLSYAEIWISESQERMVFAVPPAKIERFLKIFADENVEASVIGEFTGTGRLELYFHGHRVCDLEMSFLHEGTPKVTKEAVWQDPVLREPALPKTVDIADQLKACLGHYNVCSKEWVIRQYDHEVQGGSVIKPLVGIDCDGPSDASVVAPKPGSLKAIAVSNGINPQFGKIDPYWMAASCVDEALRQVVAVGGDPRRVAILDNFCWGNPDKPDRLGGLVRCAQGCHDAALAYETPFISGKDSLYNEYTEKNQSIAIPGTILISAIGIVEDIRKTVTMDFKESGNAIYIVGDTRDELGGSVYYQAYGSVGKEVPRVDFAQGRKTFLAMFEAIQQGRVRSAHDCSEGGIGVALAEMAFSGGLGATILVAEIPYSGKRRRDDVVLFSESNSRFLVEVRPEDQAAFELVMKGVPCAMIGRVEYTTILSIFGLDQCPLVACDIAELKAAWQQPLKW